MKYVLRYELCNFECFTLTISKIQLEHIPHFKYCTSHFAFEPNESTLLPYLKFGRILDLS